jgi:hypothetical protein
MPQWRTEEVLLENLHRFGIEVERGVTAKEIELFDDRARVVCEDALGREFVIGADYLVGAGGAHSVVRGALHEHLEGITYPLRYLVGDVSVPNFHRGDHLLTVAVSPVGMLMVVELPKGRSLVFTDLPEGQIPSQPVSIEDLQSAIAGHLKRPFEISDLRWASMYHSHRRMAPKFAQGRCFLAGDAAHICNPLGGEGMNAGILDGASLAWMLAAVLRHGGRRVLLEAYEAERHDAAAQVLASSHAAKGFYDSLVAMARAGEPLIAPEPDPAHPTTSPTMLDLKFPSSPILGTHGDGVGLEGIIVGSRFPKRTRLSGCSHHLLIFDGPEAPGREVRLPERWSSLITTLRGEDICVHWQGGVPAGGAVLVRPDGYIGFQAAAWNREALHAFEGYLERLFDPEQASVGGSA